VLIVWVLVKQRATSLTERIAWFGDADLLRLATEASYEKILKESSAQLQG
jgi:hypothetical protein